MQNCKSRALAVCLLHNGGETDVFLTKAGSLVINKSGHVSSEV